jgi:hypothetical protein
MTLAFLAVLFAAALPQASFAQSNPLVGTWKIDLAKSKYTPGPLPKASRGLPRQLDKLSKQLLKESAGKALQ